MRTIWILMVGAGLVIAAAIGGWLSTRHTRAIAPPVKAQPPAVAEPAAAPPRNAARAVRSPAATVVVAPTSTSADTPAANAAVATSQTASNSAANSPRAKKRELQDPLARDALSLVGADPAAEAYWLDAIYDSSLPDKEREDLMEDLNEDGLSDPKRPGPQDLPLILNRLAIIEELAPNADEFMLRHLGEAYKDLVNLAAITQGGGEPVR